MKTKLSNTGKNVNLKEILLAGKRLNFSERISHFSQIYEQAQQDQQNLYMRPVISPADREVIIQDPFTGKPRKMLMFGSNNYLGLANHPYVREKVKAAINSYGVGIGGPPLLNGYSILHRQLEERLAAFKHAEDAMIFSTGYSANVGLISGLVNPYDRVIYDELSHASFCDGLKMGHVKAFPFEHNRVDQLKILLEKHSEICRGDLFVGVEGVYSMDGDLAPLDQIVPLCKKHNTILMLDDAHGTGVLGVHGRGTAEYFGVENEIDITMGTFSKSFGVVGGFLTADKAIIDYLRFFARSYMFSASLPPTTIAAVLASLDVIEREPAFIQQLHENVKYTATKLGEIGIETAPEAAIIALKVPKTMNIRRAALHFHEMGIFVNSIEYPAVPLKEQRFRISLMATHQKSDIDQLVAAVAEVWSRYKNTVDEKILQAA